MERSREVSEKNNFVGRLARTLSRAYQSLTEDPDAELREDFKVAKQMADTVAARMRSQMKVQENRHRVVEITQGSVVLHVGRNGSLGGTVKE